MIERARINEALGQGRAARWVVTEGSALVDLMAWADADFYRGVFNEGQMNHLMQYLAGHKNIPVGRWWRFILRAPEVWLINTLDLARPPVPDLLVIVRQPIERTLENLRSRGEALQPYENQAFLEKLDEAYLRVGGVLARRAKVRLLELETDRMSLEEASERVAATCAELAQAGDRSEQEGAGS